MRTIDDIIPPSRRPQAEGSGATPRGEARRSRFPLFTFVAVAVIILGTVGVLYYFSTARVIITPNTVSVAVQSPFTAVKGSSDLPFEIVTIDKVASQSVEASGSEHIETAASGLITVYNTQSKAQKLVAKTRFATTAGLVFRIKNPITVPTGSEDEPGSIEVRVYADDVGDSYNIGPTSFTLPGLAGTSLASKIYARSTAPMAGGVAGEVPVVSEDDEAEALDAIKNTLVAELTANIESQVPTGYTLLPGAATTTFEVLTPAASTADMAEVRVRGTLSAVVFPSTALAMAVAQAAEQGIGYQGEPVSLLPSSTLKLSAAHLPNESDESFSFVLTGTASFVYDIDSVRVAASVAGKGRTSAETALTNYPEIKRAVLILRPFWRTTFPGEPASIVISVEKPI